MMVGEIDSMAGWSPYGLAPLQPYQAKPHR